MSRASFLVREAIRQVPNSYEEQVAILGDVVRDLTADIVQSLTEQHLELCQTSDKADDALIFLALMVTRILELFDAPPHLLKKGQQLLFEWDEGEPEYMRKHISGWRKELRTFRHKNA